MTFRDFVVGVLADELDGFSGIHYTSELAFDYYDYEKDNFGDARNPFDDPEGYLVCMMIWKAEEIISCLPIVQENDQLDFDDGDVVRQFKYELTEEFITENLQFPDTVQCRAG